jgi:hypothetical protein
MEIRDNREIMDKPELRELPAHQGNQVLVIPA